MKKILLILMLFLLCSCTSKKYEEIGYNKKQAKLISSLSKENQEYFLNEVDDFTLGISECDDFVEECLSDYLLYKNVISPKDIVRLVNNNTINKENFDRVSNLASVNGFEASKLASYLQFDKKYNPSLVISVVNNNLDSMMDFIDTLADDKFFVVDNLLLYIKYKSEKEEPRQLIEYVNTKNYIPYYSELISAEVEKYDYLVLVNKYHTLEKDYIPNDLVDVESAYGRGQLRKEAYEAYKNMQDDAKKEGYSFYITSPYRSYDTQEKLYNRYLQTDSQENVDIYSARAGTSEHQLGLAVDILKAGYDFGNFHLTNESKWLSENAYKYGFILRYPDDKVDVTGYKYEAWHYRYIGEVAEAVYKSGVTYDEYFEKYIKQ